MSRSRSGRYASAGTSRPSLPSWARARTSAAVNVFEMLATAKAVLGDGLVPLASALGDDADPARRLAIPESHRLIAYGTSHLDLLDRPEVCEQIARWLAAPALVPLATL